MKIALQLTLLVFVCSALAIRAQDGCRMHMSIKPAADSGWAELNSGMEKMQAAMAPMKSSGNNDVDFVMLMLPHHQAAIDMAEAELKFGTDPQMRRLAQEIIADQQSEIELMQLWLKQHDSSTTEPKPSSSSMR